MNKVFKKIVLSTSVALCTLGATSINTLAYDEEFKTFSQADSRWSNYVYDGGFTIEQAGCLLTSVTTLMAFANDDLRDVNTWNPQIASQYFSFNGGGCFNWGSTVNADPTFRYVGKTYGGRDAIINELNKGNYVVIHSSGIGSMGHYSPIVGVDEYGNPKVWDVGNGGYYSNFSMWESAGIDEICVYSSSIRSSKEAFREYGIIASTVTIVKDDTLVNKFQEIRVEKKESPLKDTSESLQYSKNN